MRFVLAALITALGILIAPSVAFSATTCNGVISGTVTGDVVVPNGGNCTLQNATVNGNVINTAGDSVVNINNSTVTGDIYSWNALAFNVYQSKIRSVFAFAGSIFSLYEVEASGFVWIDSHARARVVYSKLNGPVLLTNNRDLEVRNNTYGPLLYCSGNVTVASANNTGTGFNNC